MKATKSKYLKNKKALDFSWGLFMIAPTMIGLFLLFMTPPEGKRRTQSLVVQIFSAISFILGLT